MSNSIKFIDFPSNYIFIFTKIFGDTPRVKIIEFFILTFINAEKETPPWTYISQVSRVLNLSKSSVKKIIDKMIKEEFLIEKKIETHAKNPQRNIKINKKKPVVSELVDFYQKIRMF
ncbi:MAG: MarR family transcriptional regulator [archaeon]|nr:MarR family transcriptional regulator [archaeon]